VSKYIFQNNTHKEKGFTLIESLIAIGLLAFAVVSILNAFFFQQHFTRTNFGKNMALTLAESRIEELSKYPEYGLTEGETVNYIVQEGPRFAVYSIEQANNNQYRRTTTLAMDNQLMAITVRVQYGRRPSAGDPATGIYGGSITLTTKRWR
jgi:prepilin-type N-terminal cleavage/methylation domain-containing protein